MTHHLISSKFSYQPAFYSLINIMWYPLCRFHPCHRLVNFGVAVCSHCFGSSVEKNRKKVCQQKFYVCNFGESIPLMPRERSIDCHAQCRWYIIVTEDDGLHWSLIFPRFHLHCDPLSFVVAWLTLVVNAVLPLAAIILLNMWIYGGSFVIINNFLRSLSKHFMGFMVLFNSMYVFDFYSIYLLLLCFIIVFEEYEYSMNASLFNSNVLNVAW